MHGLLGGTFDPPHVGHLAMATAAADQLDIPSVAFVPAGDPWQKQGSGVSDVRHRLAMTRLATTDDSRFIVDDVEVNRSGPSYTFDTVDQMDGRCLLILGSDAALGIPSWHRANELIQMAEVAVVERSGVTASDVERALGLSVTRLSMPRLDLSSTEIRSHVAAGHSARFFVPDAVWDYISTNGLYR